VTFLNGVYKKVSRFADSLLNHDGIYNAAQDVLQSCGILVEDVTRGGAIRDVYTEVINANRILQNRLDPANGT